MVWLDHVHRGQDGVLTHSLTFAEQYSNCLLVLVRTSGQHVAYSRIAVLPHTEKIKRNRMNCHTAITQTPFYQCLPLAEAA